MMSAFVSQMQALLERIQAARTAEDKQAAKEEMAALIRAQSRGERVRPPRKDFDPRQAQTGETE